MKLSGFIFCTLLFMSTQADDTEIYVTATTSANTATQPNVLFVFDTSGSMEWEITTIEAYDPNTSYGSSDNSYFYFYEQNYDYLLSVSGNFINCQSLKDTIAAQPSNPTFNGRVARWNGKKWANIGNNTINASTPIECEADSGVHGADDTSANVYAADRKNGPYSNKSSKEINWSKQTQLIVVSANYHDYLQTAASTTRKKIDIMKDAAKDLIDDFDGLNFGLMRFHGGHGGYVVGNFEDITPAENKVSIKNIIDGLPADGSTPLTETLWEASRFYRGESLDYGSGLSVSESYSGSNYISPMTNSCQKNHIVYLTDGEPSSDDGRDSEISTLTGNTCSHTNGAVLSSQTCFDEMAQWLKTTDHSSLTDKQDITLHTIGFDINLELLSTAAQKGGGGNYNAADATELKSAFNQIIISILSTETTFVAPAVSVNAFNNLQHRDDLYYAIFKPIGSPRWAGNIKRYRITSDAIIKDANGNDAINNLTGFFKDSARSYWSAGTDGSSVTEGGFAEQMSSVRNIYTYTALDAPSNAILNLHELTTSNLSNTMMGLEPSATPAELQELIQWMRGEDTENINASSNVHNFIADPLHSRPAVVTYGGTELAPDDTVYIANNLGFLHAIDTDDGSEVFAFIPQALLVNGNIYYEDDVTVTDKVYGLDGEIVIWRKESAADTDATIEASEGDHVYLYIGMRRGGNNYYALDVTNRNNPKLMWRIEGGSGEYLDLAQTWSAPKLTKVKWACDSMGDNCTDKDVLIFGGGYDDIHDTATAETQGDAGAAVFMVDATSGVLLWSAGRPVTPTPLHDLELSEMQNSIPANLTLADINSDGYLDIMYTVDITGHVLRFDINQETTTAANFATGGIIAKLGDYDSNTSNDAENFRRFYNAPDVAYFAPRGKRSFFTVSLTSGYRSHPKDTTVTDRIYTLFDQNVFDPPKNSQGLIDYSALDISDTDPLDESDLFDATSNEADKYSNAPYGWYKTFQGTDEKGLSTPTTFASLLIFTTYLPVGGSSTVCGSDIGSGRTYAINPLTGGGLISSGSSYVEYIELAHGGIPPAPSIIYTDNSEAYTDDNGDIQTRKHSKPIVCIGTECFDDLVPSEDPLVRTYWKENSSS